MGTCGGAHARLRRIAAMLYYAAMRSMLPEPYILLHAILGTAALVISLATSAIAIWIYAPSPNLQLWRLAVFAVEQSVWLALAGLAAAILGLIAWAIGSHILGPPAI